MKILSLMILLLAASVLIVYGEEITLLGVPIYAQESDAVIPVWVKGVASFWVQDEITDTEFIEAMEFLIETKIIEIPGYGKITSEINIPIPSPEIENSIAVIDPPVEILITVTTDKKSYQSGDIIIISGTTLNDTQDKITTVVVNPEGMIVTIAQIKPNSDASYSTTFSTSSWMMSGEYEFRVQQGSQKISTTINFVWNGVIPEPEPTPVPEPEPIPEPSPEPEPDPKYSDHHHLR